MSEKLPEGWNAVPLTSIALVTSGGTPTRDRAVYWNGNIPWVTTSEVSFNTITTTNECITEVGLTNSAAKIFPAETLLIALYGQGKTRGTVAKLGIAAATNQACAAICFNSPHNPSFYFYYFQNIYSELRKMSNAGSQKNLSLNLLKTLLIYSPPHTEQQTIARILSTWDAAITCTQKLLENSKQQKKTLMQQLLTGRRRLPGFNTVWQQSTIRELSNRVTRKSDGKTHPILTISSTSGFVRQDSKYRRYMAGKSVNSYILLHKGEFAYNKGNSKTYEFGCIFPLSIFETGLVPHVYVCFKIHSKYCAEFYKYLFENDYLKKQLGDMVNTGVRNNGLLNIKPEEFLRATVPVPPLEEQKAIAKVLSAADALIAQYEARLAHLQKQKKALMQQLLTGKIRVTPDTPDATPDTSGDACETPA